MRRFSTQRASLAAVLAQARFARQRITGLPDQPLSLPDAYAVLSDVESALNDKGWPTVAYKVGATSSVIQQRLGLAEPFWGPIFKPALMDALGREARRFSVEHDQVRGVEAEFAFIVDKDIEPRSTAYTQAELLEVYCPTFAPAVEVCATRLPAGAPLSGALTVADGAGNGAIVLDRARASHEVVALGGMKTWIKIDGVVVAQGTGAEVLGHPGAALEWFVNRVVHGGRRALRRGNVISSGATCGLVGITKQCYVTVEFGASNDDKHRTAVHLAFRR